MSDEKVININNASDSGSAPTSTKAQTEEIAVENNNGDPSVVAILNALENSAELKPLLEAIDSIMQIPENSLTPSTQATLKAMFSSFLTPELQEQAAEAMVQGFDEQHWSKQQAIDVIAEVKNEFNTYVNSLNPSPNRRMLIDSLFELLYQIFDTATDKYLNYTFVLPMTVGDGAHILTYGHDTDVGADIYAAQDITLKAHSLSNVVPTNITIQLPSGYWAAVVPRSSIGAKTGLRLSNSIGVIDESYRGYIGVLYDNIGATDYTIHAGDRIAQMLFFKTTRVKPQVVDKLTETERGTGAYGSTGK